MLKRSTWIWLAIAVGLGSGIVVYDQVSQQQEEQKSQENLVLGIEEDQIKSLAIEVNLKDASESESKDDDKESEETVKQRLLFTRPNAEEAPTQWQVKIDDGEPVQASDGAIAFLTNLIATAESDGQLTATKKQLSEYGLNQPRAQLTITLKTGDKHKLQLGSAGFDDQFVYAQIEPPQSKAKSDATKSKSSSDANKESSNKEGSEETKADDKDVESKKQTAPGEKVQTIPKDFEYALIRDLDEWKYTPPPSPSPSESSDDKEPSAAPTP
ncbi:MAG: DUF4340 domain-containing protein [Cyanobacteria bacterium P01_D01_bin.73]